MSLYDYINRKREWEQLWTDNRVSIWFEKTDSKQYPYEVFKAVENSLFDDEIMIMSVAFCVNLSQAFDIWNGEINKHLDIERKPIKALISK